MQGDLNQWAIRHRIPYHALTELRHMFQFEPNGVTSVEGESEAAVQARVRLEAAGKGIHLWRNNVGVLLDKDGRPVRYGLANDSKKLNETVKSGDLIGWRPVVVTADMVGRMIAQFVSRECKPVGWRFTGTAHETAQLRWAQAVLVAGGDACFVTGEGTL